MAGEYIQFDKSDFAYSNEHIAKGILLTPEILEKCGFTKTGHIDTHVYSIGDNEYTCDWLMEVKYSKEYGFYYRNAKHKLAFIHQLQNIFYALTGEELQINLL
jgi:hypothetical protein